MGYEVLYLAITFGTIFVVLFSVLLVAHRERAQKRKYNDLAVQQLLDEIRDQRIREMWEHGSFEHPPPQQKVINVDFSEVESHPNDPLHKPLKYKLVYDEYLGIYRKVRR
tara:strand:- start:1398 stop:1727 length:330 start_codon:yes stop_codon:yes gene_type:complete